MLFQRASYLVTDGPSWQAATATPAFAHTMHTLADVVRQLQGAWEPAARQRLAARIQALLDHTELPQGRLRIFYRSVLHTLLLLCRESFHAQHDPFFRKVPWRAAWSSLCQRFSPARFEFRFALRLAVVMTISTTVSFLWEFEHTYWFPLHAFLLLQPSYEESAHRMVTRPVGTAICCIIVHLVYPWLPGLPGIFVFSLIMIPLMYCCTPGTWVHPIFSTSFALTMATLTVQETEAIGLRLMYLAMAIALVLVVNAFLLPNRKEPQFRRNFQELYRLQAYYWEVIRRSLRQPVDPALFSELLSQFHMVYHEAAQYTDHQSPEEADYHRKRLVILWNMFSELEQTEGLIQSGAVTPEEQAALDGGAAALEGRICPLTDLNGVPAETLPQGELCYVVRRYMENAQALLTARARKTPPGFSDCRAAFLFISAALPAIPPLHTPSGRSGTCAPRPAPPPDAAERHSPGPGCATETGASGPERRRCRPPPCPAPSERQSLRRRWRRASCPPRSGRPAGRPPPWSVRTCPQRAPAPTGSS